jgi:hypothetical protein
MGASGAPHPLQKRAPGAGNFPQRRQVWAKARLRRM